MLNMKHSILIKTALVAASLPLFAGCVVEPQPRRVDYVQQSPPGGEVVVEQPAEPPPVQVEVRPAPPDPTYVWIGGVWEWRGSWVWIGGHWDRPHPGRIWARGHWEHGQRGYVWIGAGWR
jgi:hypothetical protein